MPFAPSSFLFLAVRPGAPSSFLLLVASGLLVVLAGYMTLNDELYS